MSTANLLLVGRAVSHIARKRLTCTSPETWTRMATHHRYPT